MGSVSQEGNVGNVNNRGAGDSIEVSPGDGLEVGDMVWGKVKSHPWWPGHVYSEELATPSVLRSKRDGQLLVAFFGDSSYGWFNPSELIPFDSNFSEKSQQTNSRTFVKALEEAIDEVRRRSALGLSCMCRNKQNFRQTDVQGFYAVDVVGYEPEIVYSIDTIVKARVSFQPWLVLEFVRELALESTDEHDDTDFIKNKATVMSYRRAVYEEIDETYDQALGGDLVRPLPGSVQVSTPRKKPAKAPLSGQQVFGDTVGKLTKLNKLKDHHANKDNYLFKTKIQKVKESTHIEDPVIATLKGSASTMEEDKNLDFEINTPIRSLIHTQNHIPCSKVKPLKRLAGKLGSGKSDSPEKKKKRKEESLVSEDTNGKDLMEKVSAVEVAGERSSGNFVLPENKKKRKKESLMAADGEPPQLELSWVLANLHSFALDPFHTNNNRKLRLKLRQVFLKFRSLAFQKGLNSVTENEANSKSTVTGAPPLKPPPTGRPDDPTKGGIKREEIAAKKKKKITDLQISKKVDEDGGRQAAVVKPRKPGQQRAVEPTVLKMEFPSGGSLPSIGELKAKLGRYGAMDHDRTRVYWKTFTCLVVYKNKADALAALAAVDGGCNLFGNTDVKYSLKQVSDSQPPPKVSHHHPVVVEDRVAMAVAALKSCLKKSGGEEGGGRKTSRVKLNFIGGGSRNSKSLQKGILPLPISTGVSTPPPPPRRRNSMHYRTPLAPPKLPPRSIPPAAMQPPPNIDIAQQMVSLLTRCNDVVAHIKGILGYVPCHPL